MPSQIGGYMSSTTGGEPHPATANATATVEYVPISRCPDCGCVVGKHIEVTEFDESTCRVVSMEHSLCECGCDYYVRGGSSDLGEHAD